MSVTPAQYEYYMAHEGDDRRPNRIAGAVCGLTLALLALGARITSRIISGAKFGLDDLFCCVGTVGVVAYGISMFVMVANGGGLHIIFVKSESQMIQVMVASIVFYAWAVMFTKYSILLYYRRIFKVKWLYLASTIMGLIVVAYNVALIFVAALECIPLSSMWTGKEGSCFNTKPPYAVLAIVNVVTDVAILALPVVPVMNLNMKLRRKIQVLGIFMTGGVVCVFGIVRCVAIATMHVEVDPSYNETFSTIWSFIEISVGVVAACLPTLGPFFKENSFQLRSWSSLGSGSGFFSSRRRFFSSAKDLADQGSFEPEHLKQINPTISNGSQEEYMLTSNSAFYNTAEFDPPHEGSPKIPEQTHIIVQHDIEQSERVSRSSRV